MLSFNVFRFSNVPHLTIKCILKILRKIKNIKTLVGFKLMTCSGCLVLLKMLKVEMPVIDIELYM